MDIRNKETFILKEHNAYINHLFQRYLEGSYSEEELDTLLAYFKLNEDSAQLRELIEQQFYKAVSETVDLEDVKRRAERIGQELEEKINRPVKIKRFKWWYVAASIVLLLSIGTITYLSIKDQRISNQFVSQFGDDVIPGGNRAYITLSTGQKIELDSTKAGLTTTHGKHAYADGTELAPGSVAEFATIHTPVGGQYHITLPDGSEAWLNAASSIKYPVQFERAQRLVETTGEVYLEVKADTSKPFIVQTGEQRIQVLGTAFNVRSYQSAILTTLVHGKIALEQKGLQKRVVLLPGDQTIFSGSSIEVSKVNPDDFIAWKNGIIFTNEVPLKVVCAEIERWYGVTFIFPAGFNNKELALNSINNKEMLSSVLAALKNSYKVDFEVRGKEVYVK